MAAVVPRSSDRIAANRKAVEEKLLEQQKLASESIVKIWDQAIAEGPPKRAADSKGDIEPVNEKRFNDLFAKQQTNWKKFVDKRRNQKTTKDAIRELFTIGQMDLALINFGPRYVALWETNFSNETVRDIFELADVDEQCNNTIGAVVPGTTLCWICGMPIWAESKDLPCKSDNGLSPECEHILPIAQAALFLQLYDKTNYESDLFKFEYDWSHKTCNQTKNADVYFKTRTIDDELTIVTTEDGLPVFDEAAVRRLLEKIYDSKRSDATCEPRNAHVRNTKGFFIDTYSFRDTLQDWVNFKYLDKGSVEQWKKHRIDVFRAKYTAIINFIGGTNFKLNPQTYILSLASAIAEIVTRQDLHRRAVKGQSPFRRQKTLGYKPEKKDDIDLTLSSEIVNLTATLKSIAEYQNKIEILETPPELKRPGPPPPSDPPPEGAARVEPPFPPPYDQLPLPMPEDLDYLPQLLLGDGFIDSSAFDDVDAAAVLTNIVPQPPAEPAVESAARSLSALGQTTESKRAKLTESQSDSAYESDYGGRRRTRRRTSSFLPHRRRRSHQAIRTSSRRRPALGMADSF